MNFTYISLTVENQIALITINRTDVLNALNLKCVNEIKKALEACGENDDVLCVVFTGAGEKAFAAGADIEELTDLNAVDMIARGGMQEIFTYLYHFEKPTIAKVKGYALGGGLELALACDIRIAAENAKFGFPELNLAIIPGAGGTQRLAKIIGEGHALHLSLTGEVLKAEAAKNIGMISAVYSLEEIDEKVNGTAKGIAKKGPLAAQLTKLAIKQNESSQGLLIEKLAQAVLFETKDKKEGTQAFLEKRKPEFERR